MRQHTRLLIAAFGLSLVPACSTYEVYRGARVPRPLPSPTSSQPMTGVAEAGFSAGGFAETQAPAPGETDAGVHLPRAQGRAELKYAINPYVSLGLLHERALQVGSRPLVKGTPEPDGDATGYGLSMNFSGHAGNSPLRLGLGVDFMVYGIPYVEYRVCVDNCAGEEFIVEEEGVAGEAVLGVHLLSSYALSENLAITGGATLRNHPTIERTGIEGEFSYDDVKGGPLNVTLAAGVEYRHQSGVRASLQAYQTVPNNPVQYYPALAFSLSIPLYRNPPPPLPFIQSEPEPAPAPGPLQ